MKYFSNEIVFRGHPDKVADQISAAILKECVKQDKNTRAGIEVTGGKGKIFITGEVTTNAKINVKKIAKRVLADVGYSTKYKIIDNLGKQSADIALGVDVGGAGDQGMMFGYACNDTDQLLPTAMVILQEFAHNYDMLRKCDSRFLPDGKAQITGLYDDNFKLVSIRDFTISYQNTEKERDITDEMLKILATRICKKYGIPQNRERVFAISIRKDIDIGFQFPETVPLQIRLKDMLEHNVDEKYYINNEKTEALLAQLKDKLEDSVQTIKVSNQATVVDGFTDEAGTLMARDWKGFGNQAMAAVVEPFVVASRGRDSDNPNVNTEQKLEPNFTGCTNTITSVQKDNWVAEPTRLGNIYGEQFGTGYAGNVWDKNGISPALMTMQGGNRQPLVVDAEPIIYDDYSGYIPKDKDAITTLTTNCGNSAIRNGVKIIEPIVCEQRCDEGIRLFKDEVCGTLRTIDACGDKRVVEPGIRWRIRKLTEKCCWRLMGFSDEDVDRAAKFVSASALYKQAGNSIVTSCLVAIFYSLLFNNNSTEWSKYIVDFNS